MSEKISLDSSDLNNKYFTLLENGSVYGTGNNSNNHR